ncbi:phospholipase A2 inhibitor beta-like [Chironomus tepperi]|uniref:phospholipase A2 inhibitor beta-like n=1 Tax=Chironomus tepperi TaxID=113505 RepID=UPI00391F773A
MEGMSCIVCHVVLTIGNWQTKDSDRASYRRHLRKAMDLFGQQTAKMIVFHIFRQISTTSHVKTTVQKAIETFPCKMWSWKHSVSVAFVYVTVASFFIDLKHYFKSTDNTYQLECADPSGDESVTCHFTKIYTQKLHFNITMIHTTGNFTVGEIQQVTNIGLHKYNMPEYMPGNLGIFFPKLEELHITHSILKHLIRDNFNFMTNLLILNLDNNEIELIPRDTFYDLHNLVFLKLNGNKIKELHPPLVDRLHHLHTFSAVNNKISRVDARFFRQNRRIKWIYLAGNRIERLGIDFRLFRHLKAVDLRRNSKDCSFLFNVNRRSDFTIANFQKNVTNFCSGKI